MKPRPLARFVLASMVLTVPAIGAETEGAGSVELLLVHDRSVVELAPETKSRLTTQMVAYFETCLTHAAVVGEAPQQESLRRTWEEQERGTHALVQLPAGGHGRESLATPTEVLVGFSSGPGAWPVLSRDRSEGLVLYSKCDGLDGLLLACDVNDVAPGSAIPRDCDRIREIKRQVSGSE